MAKDTKPGEELKKVNKEAHDATYDKSGDLRIKSETPVAAVEGGELGSADTGVKAKVQEPVSGTTVNPSDTVDRESLNEPARQADRPAQVETKDGKTVVDEEGVEADRKAKEATLKATGADDTEAAKNAVESQKENKAANKDGGAKDQAGARVGK